jgi:hypothetical protein
LQRRAGGRHQLLGWRRASRLQKGNSTGRVLREAGGDDRTSRPAPYDSEIERPGHAG